MKFICVLSSAYFCVCAPSLAQTVANGTPLNLSGATPTLDIDVNTLIAAGFSTGENPWWGSGQLAPQPFTSPYFAIAQGLPPNAASPAINVSAGQPFWSSYGGENEAYPNQDMAIALASHGDTPPLSLANGSIGLTASYMSYDAKNTLPANLANRVFQSAALNTYPFGQLYGYFEVTASIPQGDGEWPATWLVPINMNGSGPDVEIDIVEALGNITYNYFTTLHSGDYANQPTPGQIGAEINSPTDLSLSYHRYGVDWEPNTITFYFDGSSVFSAPTPSDMHVPMFLIANLALGGWLGGPDSTTPNSATFSISSIRAWQTAGN